ncbi:hypothetical protein [Pseudomonas aeruginosa]|uniref:hypothetical protein n=1 Tax=Pseudomonas aeruginosa TaxID=287 RepID=UPI0003D21E87|nr:hypothetical protein [Pseudomonas aeruginosa]AHB56390.1 hypothetical protein U769_15765 [Pseudomonas aeruginosa MTB-1]
MSIELNKESVEQADASSCQGTNCGTTTGDHSSECLAEAAAGQGWELKPGDLCGRDCPIHKILAEQAGGDERGALQELIRVRDWVKNRRGQPEKLKNTGQTYIMIEKCETLDMLEWAIERARAALAQPSPASDLDPLNLAPHAGAFNEAPDEALRPEQAEAERPEVVAWQYRVTAGPQTGWSLWHPGKGEEFERSYTVERRPLMTVAQYERITAQLHDALDECDGGRWKLRSERDAALARVAELEAKLAELESQEPVSTEHLPMHIAYARAKREVFLGSCQEDVFRFALIDLLQEFPLYAAPVAQAQHSVPEGWMLVPVEPLLNMMSDKDHDTRITAERQLLSILAAAPGKEG